MIIQESFGTENTHWNESQIKIFSYQKKSLRELYGMPFSFLNNILWRAKV